MIRVGVRFPARAILSVDTIEGYDLTKVTAAELIVETPDGAKTTWVAKIGARTADTVEVIHEYAADGTDLVKAGGYSIFARLTVPGGSLDSEPVYHPVLGPHNVYR